MSRKIQVTVLHGSEEKPHSVEVNGWATGVPGLVVTQHATAEGRYVISHIPSGRAFGGYVWRSIAAAQRACEELATVADWSSHVGYRNSITGDLLLRVREACGREGRHIWDDMWSDDDV